MQTYSHYIITAAINRAAKQKGGETPFTLAGRAFPPIKSMSLMVGSVAPDIPLILLAIGAMLYDGVRGIAFGFEADPMQSSTGWLFEYAFFNVWWVKALHNLFHAPLLLLFYLLIGYWVWQRGKVWGASLFWFATSCLFHTALDIPLHYDDGPLLFFPFDWQTRFYSPVSYWDPNRFGRIFAPLEHLLILGLLIYLVVGWWQDRRKRRIAEARLA